MMSDCGECGAKDIGGSHGCLAFDVVIKAHRELQAKYEKALAFIRLLKNEKVIGYRATGFKAGIIQQSNKIAYGAEELLKELEGE